MTHVRWFTKLWSSQLYLCH